jgi:hypothetical protein
MVLTIILTMAATVATIGVTLMVRDQRRVRAEHAAEATRKATLAKARDARMARKRAKLEAEALAVRKARVLPYAAPERGRYVWRDGKAATWVALH